MRRSVAAAILSAAVLVACGEAAAPQYTPPPPAAAPLVEIEGSWTFTGGSVDSAQVEESPDLPITVVFTATTAGGSAGCNGYTAQMSLSGSTLLLSNFVITEIACDDSVAALAEERFLSGLRRTTAVERVGPELMLSGAGVDLRFRTEGR